jgi:Type IX secretion system membrane protein PorP/SprF
MAMRKWIVWNIMFCLMVSPSMLAQQDPVYSMSSLQPLLVNPAAIGTRSRSEASVQFRNQWSGATNAKTVFAQYNGSYHNGQLATGMSFLSDRYGAFNRSMLSGIQSYQLQAYGFKLSVALNANLEQYTFGVSDLVHSMNNEVDQALLVSGKQTIVNFGASGYAFSRSFLDWFCDATFGSTKFEKSGRPQFSACLSSCEYSGECGRYYESERAMGL